MFKVKGATVYPSEVEAALRSVDAVRQAYVTDVAAEEAGDGAEVGALVVTDAPLDEVAAAVRERLSTFKVPSRWLLTTDAGLVPTSATGKVDKAGLQQLLQAEGSRGPEHRTPSTQERAE
jgi:acyl-CoA synthetase (AMP-forming)/AMP-acid ligase II